MSKTTKKRKTPSYSVVANNGRVPSLKDKLPAAPYAVVDSHTVTQAELDEMERQREQKLTGTLLKLGAMLCREHNIVPKGGGWTNRQIMDAITEHSGFDQTTIGCEIIPVLGEYFETLNEQAGNDPRAELVVVKVDAADKEEEKD